MEWAVFISNIGEEIFELVKKFFANDSEAIRDKLSTYLKEAQDNVALWTQQLANGAMTEEEYKNAMQGKAEVIKAALAFGELITEEEFGDFVSGLIDLLLNSANKLLKL